VQQLKLVIQDFLHSIKFWRIWLLLSWQDIRLRYRRSQLGPFWITLNMTIMIYSMGFLYAHLFHIDLKRYFPYIASGLVVWSFVSAMVTDSSVAFVESAGFIRQIKLPYTIYLLRIIIRNLIIFLHNIIPVIPVMIYFHILFGWHDLYLLWGIFMITLCSLGYGAILAILSTRFRDIQPIVVSVMQLLFLLTPVVWSAQLLPNRLLFATRLNPFAQLVELLRAPLMGYAPSHYTIIFVLLLTVVGLILMLFMMSRFRHRIVFWL
jgi:ABC-type polysaccharide/polyol phosphate export permease